MCDLNTFGRLRRIRHAVADAVVVAVARRQVSDLPGTRLRVVEHRLLSCRCPGCGLTSTAAAPAHAPVPYGPAVAVAVVAVYLLVAHHEQVGPDRGDPGRPARHELRRDERRDRGRYGDESERA